MPFADTISYCHFAHTCGVTGAFLDVFYEVVLKYTGDAKRAKKVLKDMIKISVKIGLLYRHNQFSEAELGGFVCNTSLHQA